MPVIGAARTAWSILKRHAGKKSLGRLLLGHGKCVHLQLCLAHYGHCGEGESGRQVLVAYVEIPVMQGKISDLHYDIDE